MEKLISTILSVLIICPLLTACGGKEMGMGKVKQTNKELTIRVYVEWQQFNIDPVIGEYMAKYPDVKLNVERVSSGDMGAAEYTKKLAVQIMSGKGPDIICTDLCILKYSDINKMMSTGIFAD